MSDTLHQLPTFNVLLQIIEKGSVISSGLRDLPYHHRST
jgi:hypothetical protein